MCAYTLPGVISPTKLAAHPFNASTNNVVNTVGAGDALFSAFLNFYSKGTHPLKALQLAEFFASRKIAFNGASEGFCEEKDILDMYREMERINICEVDIDSRGYNHD